MTPRPSYTVLNPVHPTHQQPISQPQSAFGIEFTLYDDPHAHPDPRFLHLSALGCLRTLSRGPHRSTILSGTAPLLIPSDNRQGHPYPYPWSYSIQQEIVALKQKAEMKFLGRDARKDRVLIMMLASFDCALGVLGG